MIPRRKALKTVRRAQNSKKNLKKAKKVLALITR